MNEQVARHTKYFTIEFRDVDSRHRLRMSALVNYMQEISSEHANGMGIAFGSGPKTSYYWIVSRSTMQMTALPTWKDTIKIETAPVGVDGLFAVRYFWIYDENNIQIEAFNEEIGILPITECLTNKVQNIYIPTAKQSKYEEDSENNIE